MYGGDQGMKDTISKFQKYPAFVVFMAPQSATKLGKRLISAETKPENSTLERCSRDVFF